MFLVWNCHTSRIVLYNVSCKKTKAVAYSADNVCARYSAVTTKNKLVEDPVSSMPKQRDPRLLRSNGSDPGNNHTNLNVFKHFQWIGNVTPCFSIHGSQIHVLNDPSEFYEALKARNKVFFFRKGEGKIRVLARITCTASSCEWLLGLWLWWSHSDVVAGGWFQITVLN